MRRVLAIGAVALSLSAFGALAEPTVHWNGVGWYQVEDLVVATEWIDGWILAGPFDGKDACQANLPADDNTYQHHCEYLDSKPAWD
jgi:hypothetical protein